MNRTMKNIVSEAPDRLMGTLAVMGFAAEDNLRDVAHALGKRDLGGLGRVEEHNAKQARLRAEVEEQIVEAMSQPIMGSRERRKLILTSQIAAMFERMGSQTVEITLLCRQLIRDPKPSRVTEIKKLIEHAVYITDRAATGLVEEDIDMAKIAQEQRRAAVELYVRINRELAAFAESRGETAIRADLLCRIACKAHGIIAEAGQLANDVVSFLEKVEF
jgi:phosphate uptake regulator